jgi:hypothetical protein
MTVDNAETLHVDISTTLSRPAPPAVMVASAP